MYYIKKSILLLLLALAVTLALYLFFRSSKDFLALIFFVLLSVLELTYWREINALSPVQKLLLCGSLGALSAVVIACRYNTDHNLRTYLILFTVTVVALFCKHFIMRGTKQDRDAP